MILPLSAMQAGQMQAGVGPDAPVLVIGGGACGLVAALSVQAAGREVIVLERDRVPSGSTALSSGFVPAAGTRFQRDAGIEDAPGLLAADILAKTHGQADPAEAQRVAHAIGPALEWLADRHGIPFTVLDGFLYPGHGRHRMHTVPERTGAALMGRLLAAAEAADIQLLTSAHATALFADDAGRVLGVRVARPDGSTEDIGCGALILACSGYGGAPDLVAAHIPDIAEALYFGHAGNAGDALRWGQALGADARDLSGYQGHGNVAHPHGVLITWALMMEGGIQVNAAGQRFSNEHSGYSEQAVAVLAQPGGIAWTIFDERLHALGRDFDDFRAAEAAGAIRSATDVPGLAAVAGLPEAALLATFAEAEALATTGGTDRFGRQFGAAALAPPYRAIRVTGALFHTQGGLVVDDAARVLRPGGRALPNLFAGGGAARGVSGPEVGGYLSGNGLLTAIAYGRLAGVAAAEV